MNGHRSGGGRGIGAWRAPQGFVRGADGQDPGYAALCLGKTPAKGDSSSTRGALCEKRAGRCAECSPVVRLGRVKSPVTRGLAVVLRVET